MTSASCTSGKTLSRRVGNEGRRQSSARARQAPCQAASRCVATATLARRTAPRPPYQADAPMRRCPWRQTSATVSIGQVVEQHLGHLLDLLRDLKIIVLRATTHRGGQTTPRRSASAVPPPHRPPPRRRQRRLLARDGCPRATPAISCSATAGCAAAEGEANPLHSFTDSIRCVVDVPTASNTCGTTASRSCERSPALNSPARAANTPHTRYLPARASQPSQAARGEAPSRCVCGRGGARTGASSRRCLRRGAGACRRPTG